jgi:hypothetical protein
MDCSLPPRIEYHVVGISTEVPVSTTVTVSDQSSVLQNAIPCFKLSTKLPMMMDHHHFQNYDCTLAPRAQIEPSFSSFVALHRAVVARTTPAPSGITLRSYGTRLRWGDRLLFRRRGLCEINPRCTERGKLLDWLEPCAGCTALTFYRYPIWNRGTAGHVGLLVNLNKGYNSWGRPPGYTADQSSTDEQ